MLGYVKCKASRRDMAFLDLACATNCIQFAMTSKSSDDIWFWKDAAMSYISHARKYRLAGRNYPSLP